MQTMTSAARAYEKARNERGPHSHATRDAKSDVMWAAQRHVGESYIEQSFLDGSSGRKTVTWSASDQCFTDWGNNYWLHGPDSFLGEKAGGVWMLRARHENEVIVKAILDRARNHSKYKQHPQDMWRLYWQLLLMDALRYAEGAIIDLHLEPLDTSALAPKPELLPHREVDYIHA